MGERGGIMCANHKLPSPTLLPGALQKGGASRGDVLVARFKLNINNK